MMQASSTEASFDADAYTEPQEQAQPGFDVYVRKLGRWHLFAQHPAENKFEAIAEAERLDEQPDLEGVRVVTRKSSHLKGTVEVLVWMSPRLVKGGKAQPRRGGGGGAIETKFAPSSSLMAEMGDQALISMDAAVGPEAAGKTAPGAAGAAAGADLHPGSPVAARAASVAAKMAGRITLAVVIAGALAGAAALGMVPFSAQLPEYGITLPEETVRSLPLVTFATVFFVISGVSISLIVQSVRRRRREAEVEAGEAGPMADGGSGLAESASNIPVLGPAAASEPWQDSAMAPSGTAPGGTPMASPVQGSVAAMARPGTSDAAAAGKNNPKLILMRFLEGVLVAIQNVVKKLDSYNMFALNLFLAGAVERLAEALTLDKGRQAEMMVQALAAVGTKADIAVSFDQKLPEYRKDSKYRSMIECGRGAMDGYLVNRDDPFGGLPGAFAAWNDPTVATAVSEGIIVIMFTDMVGSTKLTHEHGDYGAQSVVRAHNAIVRAALAQHGGREVKHTGDGIMAVFFTGASAVQATIDIQHEVVRHNEGTDVMPLKIRIGLNAGKVIHEEDDYYGAAVQLAARVCAVAGPDQIAVTESVTSLCKGRDFEFVDHGKHSLKGIEHPVQVYEVVWRADAMV